VNLCHLKQTDVTALLVTQLLSCFLKVPMHTYLKVSHLKPKSGDKSAVC
jgi:hypothetical protein